MSVTEANKTTVPVTVSASAAKRIAAILAKEPAGAMLRVAVEGGGCSGFQYKFKMKYKFKVVRRTQCTDQHTVIIDAASPESAKERIFAGDGYYVSLDRDELENAEIVEIFETT